MDSRRATIVVCVVVAVLLGAWVKRYFSPEQVVRRQLSSAVEAFEQEQLLAVVSVFSRQYNDQWGQSYESVAGYLSEIMASFSDLDVDLDLRSVERDGAGVRVRLGFVVSGNDGAGSGYVLGSLADPCTATIRWREEPQGWRIITTEELDIPELRNELDRMSRN